MPTIERSLIYVSRKLIQPTDEASVEDIVAFSSVQNAVLGITGALVSAGGYFAQILEGHPAALDQLMDSIHRDGRHSDVTILRVSAIARRHFPGWAIAYSGPSPYLEGRIAPLVGVKVEDRDVRVDRLIMLMTGLDQARRAEG